MGNQAPTAGHERSAAFQKEAVDRAAEAYWTDYYGEYGRALVRKIPRRIKAALVASLEKDVGDYTRRAAVNAQIVAVGDLEVAPLAPPVLVDGQPTFEGVLNFPARYANGTEARERRIFRASLDPVTGEVAQFALIEV